MASELTVIWLSWTALLRAFHATMASGKMAHSTHHLTAEELASLPDDGYRRELVDGELQMMSPAGGRHGRIAGKLLLRIGGHVEQRGLGQTFAAETGFVLTRNPDTVRAPDLSFVSTTRLGDFADYPGFLPVAPDLAAEVCSPSDTRDQVDGTVRDWLRAGVTVVMVVDPETRSIRLYRSQAPVDAYHHGVIDLGDVVPGLKLDVAELFT